MTVQRDPKTPIDPQIGSTEAGHPVHVDKSWNIVPLILGALFVIVVGLAFLSTSAPAPEAEKTTTSTPKS